MDFKFGVLLFITAYICSSQALPPCTCTRNYLPICGSDGVTYANQCLLECAQYTSKKEITVVKEGPCEGQLPVVEACGPCPLIYLPVCGTDGETYPNDCVLECKKNTTGLVDLSHKGACEQKVTEAPVCTCTREKKPVCGSDGHTYNNDCLLNCATTNNNQLSIASYGPCENKVEEPICTCTREKKPVCGSDGHTYNNDCLLNCATTNNNQLSIASYGPCEDKVKVADINLP